MEHELGLLLEAGIPDLLFRPFKHWVIRYVEMNNLSTREFHDDEYVENTKPNRRLYKEVTRPYGLSLVLQKAAPGLGIFRSGTPFDHVFPYSRTGVANAELYLQLQGDSVLSILWVIGRYSPNEFNVFLRNWRSARLALRFPPPEFPKLPLPPSDYCFRSNEDQLRCPVSPDL